MLRRTWALVFALLMIASAVLVVAPTSHATPAAAAPGNSEVHPALGGAYVAPVDGYGGVSYGFYPGDGPYGLVYFEVYDPAGDLFANVSIVDHNATRDNVGSPALQVEVPINNVTGWYYSWQSNVFYTLPNLMIGGLWNLTVSAPLGGSYNTSFTVYTFTMGLGANVSYGAFVLPGETVTLQWQSYLYINGANYDALTNESLYGQYYGDNYTLLPVAPGQFTQELTPNAVGSWTFTVPANATPNTDINFTIWGRVFSNGYLAESESSNIYFYVGVPVVYSIWLSQTPNTCSGTNDIYLTPGQQVFGCVEAGAQFYHGGGFTGIAGLTVNLRYWNGTAWVSPASASTETTTNSSGLATFSFTPASPPFIANSYFGGSYTDLVNATVTVSAATNHGGSWNWTVGRNATFYLRGTTAQGDVSVLLGQAVYLPGATVSATWTIGSSNPAQTGTITAQNWWLYNTNYDILASGAITSTAQTGTITAALPAGFVGEFYLYVDASNATYGFYGWAVGYATPPTLTVTPSPIYYRPGSTASVTLTASQLPSGATLDYQVTAYFYNAQGSEQTYGLVESGTVANNTAFTIAVPNGDTPGEYEVDGWIQTAGGNVLATSTNWLYEESGYQMTIGVQTASKYSDGSFQPGETVTFSYTISSYGTTTLASIYQYEVYVSDTAIAMYFQGTSTSGTFQVTIPSNQPAGSLEVEMEVYGHGLNGVNCGTDYCYAWTLVSVNPSPSVLSLDLAPGSGVTVGWLILLIVILVVAVVLVLIFRRRRSPPSGSGGGSTTSPMSPPAPAPSSPAPPEWKEPTSSEQPPMPTPPPGAQ